MSNDSVFVIRNQFGQYLDKRSGWQSGKDALALYRASFRDEALNTLIEVNSKEISLRGEIVQVALDEKRRPVVEISESALALDQTAASSSTAEGEQGAEEEEAERDGQL